MTVVVFVIGDLDSKGQGVIHCRIMRILFIIFFSKFDKKKVYYNLDSNIECIMHQFIYIIE